MAKRVATRWRGTYSRWVADRRNLDFGATATNYLSPNGRITYRSPWGIVVIGCGVLILIGLYVILSTIYDRLWMPGRRYEPIDHSARYSLWFNGLSITWAVSLNAGELLDARVALILSNGDDKPIQAHVEKLDVVIKNVSPKDAMYLTEDIRLLPGHSKLFWTGWIRGIPQGEIYGQISYEITYGFPAGWPVYRRTHKVQFNESLPIITEQVAANNVDHIRIDWQDVASGLIPPRIAASPRLWGSTADVAARRCPLRGGLLAGSALASGLTRPGRLGCPTMRLYCAIT